MRKTLLYGEFIPKSTTGIAYMNSMLEKSLEIQGYKVTRIIEPRTIDYEKNKGIIKKNYNLNQFIKLILFILEQDLNENSFITLSMGNLGLLKTFIIQFFLKIKSKNLYLYIHRGDLNNHYNKTLFKRIMIYLIIKKSFKVILLSKIFKKINLISNIEKKILIIPNALNANDCKIAEKIFRNRIKLRSSDKKKIKLIFCGNLQKEKGIDIILNAVQNINKENNGYKIFLDLYGMQFQDISLKSQYIRYQGKLTYDNRLEIMGSYDCLILASYSEGLPMVLIECLSIGIPFITTKVGAIEDLLIRNYPYICKTDVNSIEFNIKTLANDIFNNKEFLRELIIKNNNLFKKKYQFANFHGKIKKYI